MKTNKIVFIVVFLLISVSFVSVINAQSVEYKKPKESYSDWINIKDASKDLHKLMKKDILTGNVSVGWDFDMPFSWLQQSAEIMSLCYHLFGHGALGYTMGAIFIFIATFLNIRFLAYGEQLDWTMNYYWDRFYSEEVLNECYERFGVMGCLILASVVMPFVIFGAIVLFPIDVRIIHLNYYMECLDYATTWAK